MAYECLSRSSVYLLDYTEVDLDNRRIPLSYDFYLFNYHNLTSMAWLDTRSVRQLPGIKMTLVLEVAPNDPFARVSPDHFDAYLALDPTVAHASNRVYPFPRPLEPAPALDPIADYRHPVLGTFGLPTAGKGFDKIVLAANREFNIATIRMNIPAGDHVSESQRYEVDTIIKKLPSLAKPGIEIRITRDFLDKPALIRWCSQNTLNVFLYDRAMPGLAATTDQAITSGRPLAVSANDTFRHIHSYLTPYPFRTLAQSITCSQREVSKMQEAWSQTAFVDAFERMLENFDFAPGNDRSGDFTLRSLLWWKNSIARKVQQAKLADFVPPIIPRVGRIIGRRVFQSTSARVDTNLAIPFASPLLSSFSPNGEDLWFDLVLGEKGVGFYIDVGGSPRFNSNTCRLYLRGWSGINISQSDRLHTLFIRERPTDVNLRSVFPAGPCEGRFDALLRKPALFSCGRKVAEGAASGQHHQVRVDRVPELSLADVLRDYAGGRVVDFMSVNADGYEFEVLETNDWMLRRPVFVLVKMVCKRDVIVQLLQRHDYALLINNQVNGLLVDARSPPPNLKRLLAHSSLREPVLAKVDQQVLLPAGWDERYRNP